jgi:uncharacterized protein (DUF1330 family)
MENEKEPLVEEATTEQVTESVESVQPTEEVKETAKTYTQQEVDELLKGKFTQEQVNEIVEKRLSREKNKVSDNEELVAMKSELEKTREQLVEYEKRTALAEYKISDEYKDFVKYKVSQAVTETKSFAEALKEYLENDGAKYVTQSSVIKMPRPENTDKLTDDEEAIQKMKRAMGLR